MSDNKRKPFLCKFKHKWNEIYINGIQRRQCLRKNYNTKEILSEGEWIEVDSFAFL